MSIKDQDSPIDTVLRQTVLENALDAVVGIDSSDLVIDWNLKAVEIFGFSKREAIGKNLPDLIIPQKFRDAHVDGISRFLKTGAGPILNKRIELEALHKDGTIFPVELTVIPVRSEGSFLFYSFIRDISEKKLAEKDLVLKSNVLENSLNGIDIVDSEGKFIYANKAYLEMWGYNSLEEVLKTSPASHCADSTIPDKIISTLKVNGECDIEFQARRKDGSKFDVRMWAHIAHDPTGHEIYPTTSIDITDQKRAQEAITASEEQYHQTFDRAPVGIINTGPNGKLLRVNQKLCEMLGYTSDELTALSFVDITHPDDRSLDIEIFKKLQAGELDLYDRDKRYLRKDGSYIWVKVTGRMINNIDGTPKHSVTIIQDITARKEAEDRRNVLEDQLTFLSEITKDLLSEPLGLQERLEKIVNAVVPKFADWCAVDLISAEKRPYIAAVSHKDPTKVKLAYELREKYPPDPNRPAGTPHVIKTRTPELFSHISSDLLRSMASNDDHLRIVTSLGLRSFMCVPIEAHGEILGALTIVSESKNYTQSDLKFALDLASRAALALYNSQLFQQTKDAVRVRDEFISIASHELNTPLTSMSMQFQIADRLIKKNDDKVYDKSAVAKRVNIANSQIKRMVKLISEMLDVSKISLGKLPIQKAEVSLNKILESTLEKFEEQLKSLKINYELILPNIDILVSADSYRLEQVFSNLVSNAIKYGNQSPLKIELKLGESVALVSVKDKGPGIESKDQEKIFNRFERAIPATEVSGLGLGLYISKEIVEAHNGSISVESTTGLGSEFIVSLPVEG